MCSSCVFIMCVHHALILYAIDNCICLYNTFVDRAPRQAKQTFTKAEGEGIKAFLAATSEEFF